MVFLIIKHGDISNRNPVLGMNWDICPGFNGNILKADFLPLIHGDISNRDP